MNILQPFYYRCRTNPNKGQVSKLTSGFIWEEIYHLDKNIHLISKYELYAGRVGVLSPISQVNEVLQLGERSYPRKKCS